MSIKYKKGTFTTVPNIKKLKGEETQLQALFMWICIYSNEDGECFPARSTLAKNMKVSIRTVDKYLSRLVDLGLITKEIRLDPSKKNKNLTNMYQIMVLEEEGGAIDALGGEQELHGGSEPIALGGVHVETHRTKSNLTKSNLTKISQKADPLEVEANKVIELFGLINKDWKTFFYPGPQRTSVHKIMKFAKEDNIDIGTLIQMAKDAHGVEFAPQIFTPSDMAAKYTKLIAYNNKSPQKLDPSVPYKKGKYLDDKSIIG